MIRTEEIDGKMLFQYGEIREVIVQRKSGIVHENVERFDLFARCSHLRRVRYVQGEGDDARIRMGKRLPRSGINALRTAAHDDIKHPAGETLSR